MIKQHNTTIRVALIIFLSLLTFIFSFGQDCSYLSKANDIIPIGKCAPVDVSWQIIYRGVNDKGTAHIQIQYDWDDGNPAQVIDATLTDATTREWKATHSHTYPNTGSQCNYHPRATLIVNGVLCTSSVQEQIVTVWDTDDKNGGELTIDPKIYPICVGNDALFHFTDNSQWNCTPPDENDVVNDQDRWIQWIYGTGATNIADAEVDGAVRAYPWTGAINYIPGPVEAPIAPFNTSEDIYIPNHHPVGAFFEVTLRNWNICNPYDDPEKPGPPSDLINGDFPPVTTTAKALIVDLPDASIQPIANICESEPPFLLIAADGGGQWAGPGISDPSSAMFDPMLAGPGTHQITYTITDGNGCTDLGTISIVVKEAPTANIIQGNSAHLCPGIVLNIDGNPKDGLPPYIHSWTGQTDPLSNTAISNPDFSTSTVGPYKLIYKVQDANSCWDTDTIDIDVEEVNFAFTNPNIETCVGAVISLDTEPTGGSESFVFHQWMGAKTDKLSATDIQTPDFTADEAGIFQYDYLVRDSHGCEGSQTVTITVQEQPVADAGNDIIECGLTTTLAANTSIGSGNWKIIQGPGSLTLESFSLPKPKAIADTYGTYQLRWIETSNDCTDSMDINITFVETPSPSVMANKDTCGLSIQLVANKHIGTGKWIKTEGSGDASFGDHSHDTTQVNVSTSGTYKFAWVEDNGNECTGSDTVLVNFLSMPTAQIAPPPAIACTPLEIEFENTSTQADSYYWDFGNGIISNLENPQQIFTNKTPNAVDYDIKMIARTVNGCADTTKHTITVAPTPISYFDADNKVDCSPLISHFTNKSQGGTSYQWTFGDASPAQTSMDASHTFTNTEVYTQSYKVQLVTTNNYGCRDTSALFTSVYPKQAFSLTASPNSGCSPLNVNLVAAPGAFKYEWDFGDGNISTGANYTTKLFTNNAAIKQEHTITLYTTSAYGCSDTTETNITVLPSPTATFEPNDFAICSPKEVIFTNNSSNTVNSYWDFGDGAFTSTPSNQSVQHTYTNDGFTPKDFKIKLVTQNSFGCKDSMIGFTSVNPNVEAKITGSDKACSPLEMSFGNESIGANSFAWDYGDGNTSSGYLGLNLFRNDTDNDKEYDIRMIATSPYGCSDTTFTQVTVYATPNVNFTLTPEEQQMPQSTIDIINLTTGNNWQYLWDFGDSNTSSEKQPTSHTFATYGTYGVSLKAFSDHCENTLKKEVIIIAGLPTVEYGPQDEGCPALKVDFYSNTQNAESYLWEFGDGNISSDPNPSHTYYTQGNYRVTLTVSGPGGQTIKDDLIIKVYPEPTALFEVFPNVVTIPGETVSFANKSFDANSFLWDFGDGHTSTEANPLHDYKSAGDYDITLDVTNEYGCSDSYKQHNAVTAQEGGEITFPNAFTPNTTGPGDGRYDRTDTNNYIFHPAVQKGIEEYELKIFSRWGQLLFESNNLDIGWNGYYKNKLCTQGVYIWKATCRFSTGQVKVITGDVTLLR